MACPKCGERHNPERVSCSDVQARIDGVSVGNPEGTGGLACWAGARQPAPTTEADLGEPEEWELR